jgi:hypothetical protein
MPGLSNTQHGWGAAIPRNSLKTVEKDGAAEAFLCLYHPECCMCEVGKHGRIRAIGKRARKWEDDIKMVLKGNGARRNFFFNSFISNQNDSDSIS